MGEKKLGARLEIRLHPDQLEKLKKEAAEKKKSVGSIVREVIELRYEVSEEDRLKAVQQISGLNAPVADWEQMKKEIEAEYRGKR